MSNYIIIGFSVLTMVSAAMDKNEKVRLLTWQTELQLCHKKNMRELETEYRHNLKLLAIEHDLKLKMLFQGECKKTSFL